MTKTLAVLGSTGSIGVQALEVARLRGFEIVALTSNVRTDILEGQIREFSPRMAAVADEKAAAYMKNSGLFDQTWTISISGEEWFHMKIVTDEEINKMTKSATTYAFYDPDNNLLGYAQERVTTPDQMPEAYYIIFLDADLNEKPYYASEDGHTIYTEGGTVIGSAKKEMDWSGSQCNLYVNLEDNGTQVMDFQDKYALLDMMYDEANEYYKDNK